GTETEAELLLARGSVSLAETVAVSVRLPTAVGLRTRVSVAEAPLARLPIEQVRAGLHVPWLSVEEVSVALAGKGLDRVTPDAGDGPLLVTVTTTLSGLLRPSGSGLALTETARSAAALAVTLAVELLLAVLGSNSLEATVAVFGMVPGLNGVMT